MPAEGRATLRRVSGRFRACLAVAVLATTAASPAYGATGDCSVRIAGKPVGSVPIVLHRGETATVKATAREGLQHHVYLEVLGRKVWELSLLDETRAGRKWEANIRVNDYAKWGAGLYTVVWEARPAGEGTGCPAVSGLVEIEGTPWTQPVFLGALALGLIGLLFWIRPAAKLTVTLFKGGRWVLRVVFRVDVDRREGEPVHVRAKGTVSQTLLGTLGGLLVGGGSLTALQQAALQPPTLELGFELVLTCTLAGLIGGVLRGRAGRGTGVPSERRPTTWPLPH